MYSDGEIFDLLAAEKPPRLMPLLLLSHQEPGQSWSFVKHAMIPDTRGGSA